jgi:hypothetical protein
LSANPRDSVSASDKILSWPMQRLMIWVPMSLARRGHLNRPHAEDQAFRGREIARKPKRV